MTQLITHPGTNPSIVLPVVRGVPADVDAIADHLAEPAEFFGVPMPTLEVLRAALRESLAAPHGRDGAVVFAVTVTLFAVGDDVRTVVGSEPVTPWCADAVRIAAVDAVCVPGHDPEHWERMAMRTTSRASADQLRRWLAGDGFVDAVPSGAADGAPVLGALVFDTPAGVVGLDRPEPVSILDQLTAAGIVAGVTRVRDRPADATAAWWISPRYETHPVTFLGGGRYATVAPAPFLEVR